MKTKTDIYLEEVKEASIVGGDRMEAILKTEFIKKFAMNCMTRLERELGEFDNALIDQKKDKIQQAENFFDIERQMISFDERQRAIVINCMVVFAERWQKQT